MSAFSHYAVSFTIISVLSGCLTLYLFGMNTGGPAVITWGWVAVGLMTLFVGLSMAEICSAYPTSAGLYFWAHRLAPPRTAAAWAWFTGWFNVLGQVAVTAGIDEDRLVVGDQRRDVAQVDPGMHRPAEAVDEDDGVTLAIELVVDLDAFVVREWHVLSLLDLERTTGTAFRQGYGGQAYQAIA